MSTLKYRKKTDSFLPPDWTFELKAHMYHADASTGRFLSASMLREFRACPARYHDIVAGNVRPATSAVFRFGRAAHTLLLEGDGAFAAAFRVGAPINEATGKHYTHASKAFARWLDENALDPEIVVAPDEYARLLAMRHAVSRHREAAALLAQGWPERVARAALDNVNCQIRLDWLRPDAVAVDLKTVADIDRFEADARRFGYLHQFAFYREVAAAAGAGDMRMTAVVVEKKPPYRVGVWEFPPEVLAPYAAQNRDDIARLRRCREARAWPTGYERTRPFPPAGIPPVWLN